MATVGSNMVINLDSSLSTKLHQRDNAKWGILLGCFEKDSCDVIEAIPCAANGELHRCIEKYLGLNSKWHTADFDGVVTELLTHIPKGIDVVGVFYFEDSFESALNKFSTNVFVPTLNKLAPYSPHHQSSEFLICKVTVEEHMQVSIISLHSNVSKKIHDVKFKDGVVKQWHDKRQLVRVKAEIPCQITLSKIPSVLHQECKRVLKELENSPLSFSAENSDIICSTNEEKTVGDVLNGLSSKEKHGSIIELGLLRRMTENSHEEKESLCPILIFNASSEDIIEFVLDLDTIIYAGKSWKMEDFSHVCLDSLHVQAKKILLTLDDGQSKFKMYTHKAYHYLPDCYNFMITVIYPLSSIDGKDVEDDMLYDIRRNIHEMLSLPLTKPVIMKSQNYFHQSFENYLLNPHENLKSGIVDGICEVVDGNYAYHHYMQDRFNDNGWGCAYRSLQTICSWFKLQGYTNRDIPSHQEIQEALVDVGDKPKSFISSKQWIGSFEVSICLQKLLNVPSKILHVSSGAGMANKGRELLDHFREEGTPVMIGGGVLAHTILGVHFNQSSGDIRFLILDPHYTGSENLKTVQEKGWCGWKDAKFWDQIAHYNMCMPQRPVKI